jgi:peptide/nickel transport system substrate-binding protein/oligopeptide transport system substrate-binding protein
VFAHAAADQWNTVFGDLKVNVQVQTVVDFNTFLTNLDLIPNSSGKNTLGMWAIGWLADYPDPQDWISLQFMKNAYDNISYVPAKITDSGTQVDLDGLMNTADQAQDPTTRLQEYNQAEQLIVNQVAWIPYEQQKITWRQRVWVHGFALNGTGSFADTSWPDVFITQH